MSAWSKVLTKKGRARRRWFNTAYLVVAVCAGLGVAVFLASQGAADSRETARELLRNGCATEAEVTRKYVRNTSKYYASFEFEGYVAFERITGSTAGLNPDGGTMIVLHPCDEPAPVMVESRARAIVHAPNTAAPLISLICGLAPMIITIAVCGARRRPWWNALGIGASPCRSCYHYKSDHDERGNCKKRRCVCSGYLKMTAASPVSTKG